MLSCIVGNKSVNSFDYEEAKLRVWSNKGILRCPECGERVIYCNGDYKIAYFKHEAGSECEGTKYCEPMTNEHITGIKNIYDRLKEIKGVSNLEVEKYIKNTRQRPDIYFEYEGNKYCIEYQCSPISTEYNKRHELYQLEGIKDIWILGTEKYGFDEYGTEDDDGCFFDEKKVKSIECEINSGNMPLLYFNKGILYKINKNGFVPIIRDEYKYFPKNSPLRKTFQFRLNKYHINNCELKDILTKDNKTSKEIYTLIKNTISKCELLISELKKCNHKGVKFEYNLSVDICPMYQVTYGTKSWKEFYDIEFKNIDSIYKTIKSEDELILLRDNLVKKINDNVDNYNVVLNSMGNYGEIEITKKVKKEDELMLFIYNTIKKISNNINEDIFMYCEWKGEYKKVNATKVIKEESDLMLFRSNIIKEIFEWSLLGKSLYTSDREVGRIKVNYDVNECGLQKVSYISKTIKVYDDVIVLDSCLNSIFKKHILSHKIKEDFKTQCGNKHVANAYKSIYKLKDFFKNNIENYTCWHGGGYNNDLDIRHTITNELIYKQKEMCNVSLYFLVKEIRDAIKNHKDKIKPFNEAEIVMDKYIKLNNNVRNLNITSITPSIGVISWFISIHENQSVIVIDLKNKEIKCNEHSYVFSGENFKEILNNTIHNEIRRIRYGSI